MAIRSLATVLLIGGLVLGAWLAARPALSKAPAEPATPPSLDQLCARELRIIDLGYALNARDFPVHHAINRRGRYALENLAQLDRLPPRGFYLVVAPMKIETGSGGPARVFAILPRN